jgi:hypothetical protein
MKELEERQDRPLAEQLAELWGADPPGDLETYSE